MTWTRRNFIKNTIGAAVAAASGVAHPETADAHAFNQADGPLSEILDIPLTDQHGQAFKVGEEIGNKPAILVFGYGGCQVCKEITNSIKAMQTELLNKGKEVPIIVVSVQPDEDRKDMKEYVTSFYQAGMRQYPNEIISTSMETRLNDASRVYEEEEALARRAANANNPADAAKAKEQYIAKSKSRVLHVVCPPSAQISESLEDRMGFLHVPGYPKKHSTFVALFDGDKFVKAMRSLPDYGENKTVEQKGQLVGQVFADMLPNVRGAAR